MLKRVAIVSVCLILSACASSRATPQDRKEAVSAWSDCLDIAAARRDYHTSDPSSLAPAVASDCTAEYEAMAATYTRGMSAGAASLYNDRAKDRQIEAATRAVLKERAREGHQTAPDLN